MLHSTQLIGFGTYNGLGPNIAPRGTGIVSSTSSGAAANINDNNVTTVWVGGEANAGVTNVSYAGINFGNARTIGRMSYIAMTGFSNGFANVNVQYSDNGSSWTTVATATFTNVSQTEQPVDIPQPASGAHAYWRFLATDQGVGGRAACSEIYCYEFT